MLILRVIELFMRKRLQYHIQFEEFFWKNLLNSLCSVDNISFLNSNGYTKDAYSRYEKILAISNQSVTTNLEKSGNVFDELYQLHNSNPDWLFGHFNYDVKNQLEQLVSENDDLIGFPEYEFFIPQFLLLHDKNHTICEFDETVYSEQYIMKLFKCCDCEMYNNTDPHPKQNIIINPKISKQEYIDAVNSILKHIQLGNIYEMNFCQEFYANAELHDLVSLYWQLCEISPMPFSAFYKANHYYLLCASPERFIQKEKQQIISQPIKGTAPRGLTPAEDERIKASLKNSPKETSENVMIVDLVRNDLSRSAAKASVYVSELFEVYTFKHVHQMISTVNCTLRENIKFTDAIKHAFPMGSMTGAPKIKAMQLIEQFESTKRGIYSGTVGYITPDGNFDFNVVIRSLCYNHEAKYLSCMFGGAITIESNPEQEYEECLLKAKAINQLLKGL